MLLAATEKASSWNYSYDPEIQTLHVGTASNSKL